jgi:hypothetical protein
MYDTQSMFDEAAVLLERKLFSKLGLLQAAFGKRVSSAADLPVRSLSRQRTQDES